MIINQKSTLRFKVVILLFFTSLFFLNQVNNRESQWIPFWKEDTIQLCDKGIDWPLQTLLPGEPVETPIHNNMDKSPESSNLPLNNQVPSLVLRPQHLEILAIEANRKQFNKVITLYKKISKLGGTAKFHKECLRNHLIPNTFKLKNNLDRTKPDTTQIANSILKNSSRSLMKLALDDLKEDIKNKTESFSLELHKLIRLLFFSSLQV